MKFKLVALAFAFNCLYCCFPARSLSSKSLEAESVSCRTALLDGRKRIEKLNTKVTDISRYKHERKDGPEKKPFSYVFSMTGPATLSIMKSDKFLNSISTEIISKCSSVSLIQYGFAMSDYTVTFGLMKSGKVEEFDCIEFKRGVDVPVNWGQTVCL